MKLGRASRRVAPLEKLAIARAGEPPISFENRDTSLATIASTRRRRAWSEVSVAIFPPRRSLLRRSKGPERAHYFRRYTTVVSVSAGFGVGSPYISHE